MDYQAMYQQKLTTAEEAVKVVKIRRLGGLQLGAPTTPLPWTRLWPPARTSCTDVKVRGGVTMWMPEICQGGGRRRPLHLALLALQRHRPQDHHQGHGLLQSHALLRAAPLLPGRQSGPGGRGDAPGHAHGCPRQLQLRPGGLPPGRHAGPRQDASSWRSTRICPGSTASPAPRSTSRT